MYRVSYIPANKRWIAVRIYPVADYAFVCIANLVEEGIPVIIVNTLEDLKPLIGVAVSDIIITGETT